MNNKQILIGIGITGCVIVANYIGRNNGYEQGYRQGFEDTKTKIRQDVVNLKQSIYQKEKEATNIWWNSADTTKTYTYGDLYKYEKDAFSNCYQKISDIIDYRIDRLTKEELVESIKFDKKYKK